MERYSTWNRQSRLHSLTLELGKTKHTLTRTLNLNTLLSNRIQTLTQELEHTRKEIQQLNKKESSRRLETWEIEELKFVEHQRKMRFKEVEEEEELEKRRLVTFASSPLLTRVMSSVEANEEERKKKDHEMVFERHNSVKKTKLKRGFAPFMGWFRTTSRRD